jgi:Holliday junction resolvase-like predicted endonuclease
VSTSPMLESRIETKATEYAESLGIVSLKLNVRGRVGWPDRLYICAGHIWFVEFKAPREKPTLMQFHIHSILRKQGAEVRVIDNLIDARSMLNELFSLPPVRP